MEPVWHPTKTYTEGSRLEALIRQLKLASYEDLYRFSLEQPEVFFEETFRLLGIEWFAPYQKVLDASKGIE